ncbi:MAG: ParA family protein [Pontimonas sp.]
MTRIINLFSLKGGQGVSTTAVLVAKAFAREGKSVLLVDREGGDISALLGGSDPDSGIVKTVTDNIALLVAVAHEIPNYGFDVVITDLGEYLDGAENYIVTQPCYLSLKRAYLSLKRAVCQDELIKQCDGVIIVRPADRVLTDRDVTNVLGIRHIATVEMDASVARASDAGLLASRGAGLKLPSLV